MLSLLMGSQAWLPNSFGPPFPFISITSAYGFSPKRKVESRGIEPPTFSVPQRCSTKTELRPQKLVRIVMIKYTW